MSLNTGLRLARVQPTLLSHGFTTAPAAILPLLFLGASSQYTPGLRMRRSSRFASSSTGKGLPRTTSRAASTSTVTQTKPEEPPQPHTASGSTTTTRADLNTLGQPAPSHEPSSPIPAATLLNPPASTRPPPLDLPTRDPSASLFRHLFSLGKAYTNFYKTGLKAVFTNRTLLRTTPSAATPPHLGNSADTYPSRAAILLRARVRHDLARLPVFGVVVLVCGEFTPLIVLLFPKLTPYTCRIPKQLDVIRKGAEDRRGASYRALAHVSREDGLHRTADGHICRVLGLTSRWWDRAGLDGPMSSVKAAKAVEWIVNDDRMIREGGGVEIVENGEVVLACEDRGIDVRGKEIGELRRKLESWISKTAPTSAQGDQADAEGTRHEAEDKVRRVLLRLEGDV
ncbi:Uu.00g146180.m01.CDS01 [Anthostomella pinea]|uniref:Uu.00g146180.m01.CDS01 n=1 Tax=Anthostomella pinea TaxID=933095 RepID=A0AAI8VR80_9PEZI|nr:Uu.00g146180.m01.CDS01 [Anthostomella pinea]